MEGDGENREKERSVDAVALELREELPSQEDVSYRGKGGKVLPKDAELARLVTQGVQVRYVRRLAHR